MNTLIRAAYLLFLVVPVSPQNSITPSLGVQDDNYTIYSEVIQTRFVKEGVERVVVGDHTGMSLPPVIVGMTSFGNNTEMQELRRSADKETLRDYDKKNKSPMALDQKFALKVPLALISEAEIDRIFQVKGAGEKRIGSAKGFDEFYRLYPKSPGFMTLSRVGFNPDKPQALVYVANLCGGLCGDGQIFFLVKEGGTWKIKYAVMTWIS